jgi:hypothetical protein
MVVYKETANIFGSRVEVYLNTSRQNTAACVSLSNIYNVKDLTRNQPSRLR